MADVHAFPGHIACDANSQSEIVIPIIHQGTLLGVLDLDCEQHEGFDADDAEGLERILNSLVKQTPLCLSTE